MARSSRAVGYTEKGSEKKRRCTVTGSLSLSMALQPFGPWPLFQFHNPIHSR
jgi:hypothetical protein